MTARSERWQLVVDGEAEPVYSDSEIRPKDDGSGLWEVARLFEPAPEQMPGQQGFDWPDGFDEIDPTKPLFSDD
jgi:hypothetical protein